MGCDYVRKVKKIHIVLILVLSLLMSGTGGCCQVSQFESQDDTTAGQLRDSVSQNIEINHYFEKEEITEGATQAYVILNDNAPAFTDTEKKSLEAFELYSDLDSLGRCGAAYANVCQETMPEEERQHIGQIKPSGWHTVKYNDLIDGNYLYNRCHLIGYQLAGENANEKNLITGTRYLNIAGMLPFEEMVSEYVKETNHHVLYRVTPHFLGNNLVASGVEIEAWSVEDSGEGICFHVYCYNVQPGIEIDYSNGESWVSEEQPITAQSGIPEQKEGDDCKEYTDVESQQMEFVLNLNTKKFHLPACSSVSDMAERNKKYFYGTREEVERDGYSPCKRCMGDSYIIH